MLLDATSGQRVKLRTFLFFSTKKTTVLFLEINSRAVNFPALVRQRRAELDELEASLVYTVSCKPVKATR